MAKQTTWVLVADGAHARLLTTTDCLRYDLLREEKSPDALLRTHEMVSDRQGRVSESAGSARHAVEAKSDPHRRAKEKFLRALAGKLERACRQQEFQSLVLVAPPTALGVLRRALNNETKSRVRAELTTDLTKVSTHDLAQRLSKLV